MITDDQKRHALARLLLVADREMAHDNDVVQINTADLRVLFDLYDASQPPGGVETGEPVAWRYRFRRMTSKEMSDWSAHTDYDSAVMLAGKLGEVQPLYTSPPSAAGPTKLDVEEVIRAEVSADIHFDLVGVERAATSLVALFTKGGQP